MTKPHGTAARTAELDALVLRWISEMPDDFRHRVLDRLDGYPDSARCWQWTGQTNGRGYGRAALPAVLGDLDSGGTGSKVYVHRAVWLYLRGPIPYGLVLDHDDPGAGCHDRSCGNPRHLVVTTQWSNTVVTGHGAAAVNARRTHCGAGHPLDELAPGARRCPVCQRDRGQELYDLMAEARCALGITRREYEALFGYSGATASAVMWAAEACAAAAGGH